MKYMKIYENSELKVFKNIKLLGELSNNSSNTTTTTTNNNNNNNDLLETKFYKNLQP